MSGGHTPGPWTVTETDGTWVEFGRPYGNTPIAPICNYTGPVQRAANARPTDVPLHRVRILPQSREDARFFALRRERKERGL